MMAFSGEESASCPAPTGYSLIELLTVIVVLAVLAAIAIPRLWGAGEEALRSTVRHDLRNLAVQQEIHFNEANQYAADLATLEVIPSDGVTLAILEATGSGWSSTARHPRLAPSGCAVFFGDAAAVPPATVAGQPTCD